MKGARLALAAVTGCVTAVSFYAIMRGAQLALTSEPNPATVIWSAHAGYLWRAWTALYAGGMAACLGYVASRRHAPRLARWLVHALGVASALLVVQALVAP